MPSRPSKTPRLLAGAALIFWGWQTEFLVLGLLLALLLEAAHWSPSRWEFGDDDFSRIWTFCALLLLSAAIFAFTSNDTPSEFLGFLQDPNWRTQRNAGNSSARAVASLIQWLPIIFFPFAAAAAYSTRQGVPLHTISLILRLRWRKAPNSDASPSSSRAVSVSHPYFALCLFSASIHASSDLSYFWGMCALVGWALWPLRSARFALPLWVATLGLAVGLGYLAQEGMTRFQQYLGTFNPYWFANYSKYRFDPRQTRTAIGQIGRLKQSGAILLRLAAPEGSRPPPLLREASYRGYRSQVWYAAQGRSDFENVTSETNQTTWVLLRDKPLTTPLNIACYLPGGQGLLPLPRGTARLEDLPAFILQKNALGCVHAEGPGLVIFDAVFGPGATIDGPPDLSLDVEDVPEREMAALEATIDELGLRGKSVQQCGQAIQTHFATRFTYSTWQDQPQLSKTTNSPLAIFLTSTRRGHCEYFATATVLLMRELGFPARYAVGFTVHEGDGSNRFVVRQRDAHAWALVWYNGTWHDLDTTPATWIEAENQQASPFQSLSDVWSRIMFEFSRLRYGKTELRIYILWALLPVLLLLAIQIFRKRRNRHGNIKEGPVPEVWPGLDSEFYQLESRLSSLGLPRPVDEPLNSWVVRAARSAGVSGDGSGFRELLRLHYKYRFDPRGLAPAERAALRSTALSCVSNLEQTRNIRNSAAKYGS